MRRHTVSVETSAAHVVGPGKLKVINGRLAFSTGQNSPVRLDPAALKVLFCYGKVSVTDEALALLFRHRVQVAWMTPAGAACRGRLAAADAGATLLRMAQHQVLADPRRRLQLAREIVEAKIDSQRHAMRHYQRHGQSTGPALGRLKEARRKARQAQSVDELRGIEGAASAAWFAYFGELFAPPWKFTNRVRRPPTDPVNALLSLGYTWLTNRAVAHCDAWGLETHYGALHEFRPGRPALACDLIEPHRTGAIDRWVVRLCNEGHLNLDAFHSDPNKGVRLAPGVFGRVLSSWEAHWREEGHERALHEAIQGFTTTIRASFQSLPNPLPDPDQDGRGGQHD